jgi:hypothetical protein
MTLVGRCRPVAAVLSGGVAHQPTVNRYFEQSVKRPVWVVSPGDVPVVFVDESVDHRLRVPALMDRHGAFGDQGPSSVFEAD